MHEDDKSAPMGAVARWLPWALFLVAAAFPFIAQWLDMAFYVNFVRRALIFALAAAGLNFILGFGGMVALGQAGFVGVGAYTLVAMMDGGTTSAWVLWPAAAIIAAGAAALIGLVALRTRGIYFIMITLAFAQMLYFIAVSLRLYGGDDGYNLPQRPDLGLGLDVMHEPTFYWVVLGLFALVMLLLNRVTRSRFGHALTGIRDNETRMQALGYPVFKVRMVAFVIAGAICGLAGALLVSHNSFVSPASMQWTQSATLIVMVVIGGIGRRWGGPVGAGVWILLEEITRQYTDYWHLPLGALLLLIVFFAPRGIVAVLQRKPRASDAARAPAAPAIAGAVK